MNRIEKMIIARLLTIAPPKIRHKKRHLLLDAFLDAMHPLSVGIVQD